MAVADQPQPQQPTIPPGLARIGAVDTAVGPAVAVTAPPVAVASAAASAADLVVDAALIALVVRALTRFFQRKRASDMHWLEAQLRQMYPGMSEATMRTAIERELRFEDAFQQKSLKRVQADMIEAGKLEAAKRRARLDAILNRERHYISQREQAMLVRVDRNMRHELLKQSSPDGAVWQLGDRKEHTAGCVALDGKALPWDVLDVVNPATMHTGCGCYLRGLKATEELLAPGEAARAVRAAMSLEEALRDIVDPGEIDAYVAGEPIRPVIARALQEWTYNPAQPRGRGGKWVNLSLDLHTRMIKKWFAPAQLDAKRETHPRSGYDVKVGPERRLAPPPEGQDEGPAFFNVTDHGQVTDTGFRMPTVVAQEPIQHVYRAVSEDEWAQANERGYLQSDQRGTIADWEGTNAGIEPRTATSYLPVGGTGRILKIRVDPADGWFAHRVDGYVRTRGKIPLDRVEAISPVIAKDENHFHTISVDDLDQGPLDVKAGEHNLSDLPDADVEQRLIETYERNQEKYTDKHWYAEQHAVIGRWADALKMDPTTFAAMVAATSPQMAWDQGKRLPNLEAAAAAVALARANPGADVPSFVRELESPGMLRNSLIDAMRIYLGEGPDDVLSGPKVRSFFNNLAFPQDDTGVTVDTHMARLMLGDNRRADYKNASKLVIGGRGRGYLWAAARISEAAKRIGILPHELQAAAWMQFRRELV